MAMPCGIMIYPIRSKENGTRKNFILCSRRHDGEDGADKQETVDSLHYHLPSLCSKLAAYLTIKDHLYPQVVENDSSAIPVYSYSEPPSVEYTGDSVFSQSVSDKDMTEVWKIMDELMDTLQVIQPRLYDSVIRKIDSI